MFGQILFAIITYTDDTWRQHKGIDNNVSHSRENNILISLRAKAIIITRPVMYRQDGSAGKILPNMFAELSFLLLGRVLYLHILKVMSFRFSDRQGGALAHQH